VWGGWWAADIVPTGIVKRTAEESFKRKIFDYRLYECTNTSLIAGVRNARKLIGARYDWKGLFFNLIRSWLWRTLKVKWLKPVHDVDRLFCSEFVACVLKWSNIKDFQDVDPSMISPEEVMNIMDTSNEFEEVSIKDPVRGIIHVEAK
jgi:hypothetical protein